MAKLIVSLSTSSFSSEEKNKRFKELFLKKVQKMKRVTVFYQSYSEEDDKNLLFLSDLGNKIVKSYAFQTFSSPRMIRELDAKKKNVIVVSSHIPLNLHIQEDMEAYLEKKLPSLGAKKNASIFTDDFEFSIGNLEKNRGKILKFSQEGNPYLILF